MPLLTEDQLNAMRAVPAQTCPECRWGIHQTYCRECDEFIWAGHRTACSKMSPCDEQRHRRY